jgi:hypothetical protein
VGRELNFRILPLTPAEKKIGLSMKGVDQAVTPSGQEAATAEAPPASETELPSPPPMPEAEW